MTKPGHQILLTLAAAFALGVVAPQAHADGGIPIWTNLFGGLNDSGDYVSAIAADRAGNVFITGAAQTSGSARNPALTVAYSSAGAPLWTNRYYGGGYYTGGRAIEVDANGNVFVTGFAAIDYNNGDFATVAYSSTGAHLWTQRYHGPTNGNDSASAIALDNKGNVYVTGGSVNGFASTEYATLAYSSSGVPLWTNRYLGTDDIYSHDFAYAIAADSNGNVFVTGESDGAFGTVAYSDLGVPLWTNRYSGPVSINAGATAIAVDKSGNVFVTGYTMDSYGNFEYATVAYSGAGVPLWTNTFQGPGYDDYARAIALDGSGNVYVMGYSAHSNVAYPTYDYAVVAYSGAGVALWTNRCPGSGTESDAAAAVAVDSGGNVIVTGTLPAVDNSPGPGEYATVAYSGVGTPLWTNRYSRPDNMRQNRNSRAIAIAVDSSANVIVTGHSLGTNYSYNYATIKYSSSALSAAIQVSPLAHLPGISDLIVIAANNPSACLTLEGSSSDSDHDSINYQWFKDGNAAPFASGNVATDCLGLGAHTIKLAVSDGRRSAGSASVTLQIISPCTAVGIAMTALQNSDLADNHKYPLLVSLGAVCNSFEHGHFQPGIDQLGAFEHKVQAQVQEPEPALAQKLIETVQVIINSLGGQ